MTPERRHWRRSSVFIAVFIAKFEHIPYLVLVFLLYLFIFYFYLLFISY